MNKKALIIIALCALGLCIGETHAMRACNSITINGPFEAPTGAQLGMIVHPCPEE